MTKGLFHLDETLKNGPNWSWGPFFWVTLYKYGNTDTKSDDASPAAMVSLLKP